MLKGITLLSKLFRQSFSKRFGSSLVVIEHNNDSIDPANLNVITAAKKCGDVSALVMGSGCKSVAEKVSKIENVSKVILVDKPELKNFLPEVIVPYFLDVQKASNFSHIFAPSSAFGKNLFPRVAIKFDVSPISDITGVESETVFQRSIYAGNAVLKLESMDPIKFITVRGTAFAPSKEDAGNAEIVDGPSVDVAAVSKLSEFISQELVKSDRPDLTSAKVVVSGGRALKSKEGFQIIYDLADKLGAAVGASRAAVDAGFCSNEIQVGQTGKIVAPELYIAIGISGAIQHLAGMKDSKIIVAINKDADSAIFQVSDFGLVGDLFQIVPELTQKL